MIVGITESETSLGHDICKRALEVVNQYYPRFIWYARADGGVLVLKCNAIGNACMIRHLSDLQHDAGHFTRDIIMAAGEFLERAYIKRGGWNGEYAKKLDGGDYIGWKPSYALAMGAY